MEASDNGKSIKLTISKMELRRIYSIIKPDIGKNIHTHTIPELLATAYIIGVQHAMELSGEAVCPPK